MVMVYGAPATAFGPFFATCNVSSTDSFRAAGRGWRLTKRNWPRHHVRDMGRRGMPTLTKKEVC